MEKIENSFNPVSNECESGNHDACPGQAPTSTGNVECKCIHHKNVPTSVVDIPVSNDTPWRVAHDD
jgi:hypothetical protein